MGREGGGKGECGGIGSARVGERVCLWAAAWRKVTHEAKVAKLEVEVRDVELVRLGRHPATA